MTNALTQLQRDVAHDALERQSQFRHHVVVALSGAHAYGFPSPDSDLDMKAIHIAPTRELLGLDVSVAPADLLETVNGVELDYSSNELGAVVLGILGGNGNYIERVLGAIIMRTSAEHDGLKNICVGALSRKVHRHYRGFAHNQFRAVTGDERPPAKRLLYVLRTALTGTHLLRSGELVVDVTQLLDTYGHTAARDLIDAKKAGELMRLEGGTKERWHSELERALTELDEAAEKSCLPAEPTNWDEANAWLVETRLAQV